MFTDILVLTLEYIGARVQPSGTISSSGVGFVLFANSYNFFARNSATCIAVFKNQIKSCISNCKKKTKKAPEADFVGIYESGRWP